MESPLIFFNLGVITTYQIIKSNVNISLAEVTLNLINGLLIRVFKGSGVWYAWGRISTPTTPVKKTALTSLELAVGFYFWLSLFLTVFMPLNSFINL